MGGGEWGERVEHVHTWHKSSCFMGTPFTAKTSCEHRLRSERVYLAVV